jgi:outer membrane autotransporter protein
MTGLSAATHVFSTGSAVPAVADGDAIQISGGTGSISLSGTLPGGAGSLVVNAWAVTDSPFSYAINDITIEQQNKVPGEWAVLEVGGGMPANGRALRLTAVAAGRTMTLDRIIIANGRQTVTGAGAYVAGNTTTSMNINGDVVFHNNVTSVNGGAFSTQGASLTFGGTAIFNNNKAGYLAASSTFTDNSHDGGGYYSSGAGTGSVVTFKKSAIFMSNTASRHGGGFYGSTGNSLVFEDDASFANNRAIGGSGGGVYLGSASGTAGSLTFNGNVSFQGNMSGADGFGGAIYAGNFSGIVFDGGGGETGASVFIDSNRAGRGGGVRGGNITFTGKKLTVTNNYATEPGSNGNGGGFNIVNALEINGGFYMSGNEAGGVGGAVYLAGLDIKGSGTFAGNIAVGDGGAVYGRTNSIFSIGPDVTFQNNISGGRGGAININGVSTLSLSATGGDIKFQGNRDGAAIDTSGFTYAGGSLVISDSGSPNAVYFSATAGTLNLTAGEGNAIYFYDPVVSSATTRLTVTKSGGGAVVFDRHHSDVLVTITDVQEGMLRLTNNAIYGSSTARGDFTIRSGAKIVGSGEVRAAKVTLAAGAMLEVRDGGMLTITTANPIYGNNLVVMGSGTISAGGRLNIAKIRVDGAGSATAGVLALADDISLADNAVLEMDLFEGMGGDGYNISDRMQFLGSSIIAGTGNTIDVKSLHNGVYNLGNIGSLEDDLTVTINGIGGLNGRQRADLSTVGGDLILTAQADFSRVLTWTGSNGTAWDTDSESWTDFDAVRLFAGGDRAVFSGTADTGLVRQVEIGGGGMNVSDLWIEGGANYAFTGTGGISANAAYEVKVGGSSAVDNPGGRLVMKGSGTLFLANTANNTFAGGVDLHNGTVVIGRAGQLTTGEEAALTFKGDAVLKPGVNMTLGNRIVVESGKKGTLDTDANTVTYSGLLSGGGIFEKTGDGTLMFSGSGKNAGAILVSAGTLQGDVTNLTTNIMNNAWLLVEQADDGMLSGRITGGGAVVKSGAGKLGVPDGGIEAAVFNLDEGEMVLSGGTPVKTSVAFNLAGNAVLSGNGVVNTMGSTSVFTNKGTIKVGRASGASGYGKLIINGNYVSDGGRIVLNIARNYANPETMFVDQLEVGGMVSGTVNVVFQQTSPLSSKTDFSSAKPFAAAAFDATGDVISNNVSLDDGSETHLYLDGDGTMVWHRAVAPEVPALLGVDAASILAGKASLSSLSQRLLTTRMTAASHKFQIWTNALYRHDKIKDAFYDGSDSKTQGMQMGGDWSRAAGAGRAAMGAYVDYAKADMEQDGGISKTKTGMEAAGYGIYASYMVGRWYMDALVRRAKEDYKIMAPGKPTLETDGRSWAGSLEFGGSFTDAGGLLNWEPQLQVIYQSHDIDNVTDSLGRAYSIGSADSLEGRAGVRLWLDYEWSPGRRVSPYFKASFVQEFRGGTVIEVGDAAYKNNLRGRREVFDFGVSMQLGKRISAGAAGSIYFGEKTQGCGLDLGFSHAW